MITDIPITIHSQQGLGKTWTLVVKAGGETLLAWPGPVTGTQEQMADLHKTLQKGILEALKDYGSEILMHTKEPILAQVVKAIG